VSHDDTVSALLDVAGTTYAEETGINVADSPQALYRLLVMSTLLAARINASIAIKAARGMSKAGYRSAERMADAAWRDRVAVLHDAGYTRYQERTASMVGDLSELLRDRWKGDLRRLRDDAGRDPAAERKLLKQFKGMGDVGVDVFFREVQAVWDELRPFFDERARAGAARLGLPKDPAKLAELVPAADLTRLSAALVRVELDDDVRDQVRSRRG
jgi:hypothetical protein